MLGVHTARLCSVRSLGLAKTPISVALFVADFASLVGDITFTGVC